MTDPIVGIDLGTSNTVVAYNDGGGSVRVLADDSDFKIHPSVVSFHPNGGVVVGAGAKQRKVIDPQNTIYSAKRLIGRSFRSPEVQTARTRVPYQIKDGANHMPLIVTRAGEFAVPEISAIVLDHVKNIATARLGRPVGRAVVTVPASFNDAQRSATATAGAIAGLTVLRVLNEPTAAALAYGHARDLRETIAVYDFGGGTFDITILRVHDQVYEVLGTAGDTFLGGDDLDEKLVDKMVAKFLAENRLDLRTNEVAMMRLRAVAEQTKIELSRRARALVRIDEIAYGPNGAPLNLQIEITRDEFIAHVADLIDKTFPVCREAMSLAGLVPEQISDVILVGGTTKIPYVRDQVSRFFAKAPRTDVNPEDAVAVGAALQAASLDRILARPRRTSRQVPIVDGPGPDSTTLSEPPPPLSAPRARRPDTSYSVTRTGVRETFEERTPVPTPPAATPLARVSRTGNERAIPVLTDLPAGSTAPAMPPPVPRNVQTARGQPPMSRTMVGTAPADEELTLESTTVTMPSGPVSAPVPVTMPTPLTTAPLPVPLRPPASLTTTAPGIGALATPRAPATILDVTPRGLGIATVAGFCEELIGRNARVPTEIKKLFTTSRDQQETVRIVVCQGESRRLDANTVIGDLVLQDLPPRPRGETSIEVTFALDASGVLDVRARDAKTGKEQRASLALVGGIGQDNVPAARERIQQLRR